MSRRLFRVLGRTAWIIPAIIGLGVLSWSSFLYPGLKMRSRLWLGIAAIYFALAVAVVALIATAGPSSDPVKAAQGSTEISPLGGGVIVLTWLSGMIAFIVLLPGWIRWRPAMKAGESPVEQFADTLTPPQNLSQLTDTAAFLSPQRHGGQTPSTERIGFPEAQGQKVNVNFASAEELNLVAGMPAGYGHVIVSERRTNGPFTGLANFLERMPLEPHFAARVKDSLSFGQEPTRPSHGRIVDL